MYRARLRGKHNDEKLKQIYREPHNHTTFKDHIIRVQSTIAVGKWLGKLASAADLSAGDATIINALDIDNRYVGDFAGGYEIVGPIEQTINQIPGVDLFICSETLEHLDDPDRVLSQICEKSKYILLSTPDGESGTGNQEHYWGWDTECIKSMLYDAGFDPMCLSVLYLKDYGYAYNFQIWLAEKSKNARPSKSRGGK